jgi:hypothetical protein
MMPDVARRVIQLRASAEANIRMHLLAGKSAQGTLSEEEREEYESCVHGIDDEVILAALTRGKLGTHCGIGTRNQASYPFEDFGNSRLLVAKKTAVSSWPTLAADARTNLAARVAWRGLALEEIGVGIDQMRRSLLRERHIPLDSQPVNNVVAAIACY